MRATFGLEPIEAGCRRWFRIQVLQPAEVDRSLRFNPLACFRKGQELRRLAGVLAEGSAGKDPFWTIGATNILSLVLSALVDTGNPAMRISPMPAGF